MYPPLLSKFLCIVIELMFFMIVLHSPVSLYHDQLYHDFAYSENGGTYAKPTTDTP